MSKPTATLSPLPHRGEQHIKVDIANDENGKTLIRKVTGRKWSKTHGCWYVPYSAEAYRQLEELFDVNVPPEFSKPVQNSPSAPPVQEMPDSQADTAIIRLEKESENRMKAWVPWQRKDWIEQIRSIPGRAWNQEGKYWSLPMVKTVVNQLKTWFGDQARFTFDLPAELPGDYLPKNWKPGQPGLPGNFKIVEAGTEMAPPPLQMQKPGRLAQREDAVIFARRSPGEDRMVFLQVPAGEKEWIAFVKKIPGSAWLPADRLWTVPGTQENFNQCKAFFGEKLVVDKDIPVSLSHLPAINTVKMPTFATVNTNQPPNLANALVVQPVFQSIEKNGVATKAVIGESLIVHQLNDEWLAAFVPFDKKDWLEQVKTIRGRTWETVEKYWKLPYSKETLTILRRTASDRLALAFVPSENIPARVFILPGKKTPQLPRQSLFGQLTDKQKAAVSALEKQLTLERKSYSTIKGYRNHIIQFFYFFRETLPSQISGKQIKEYFYKRIKTDEVSRSTQNGFYSALLAFYTRVLDMPDKLKYVERPPKELLLPRDLEKKEVERLIQVTDNIKHKCLLAIMYGGGLRVGELVRLRIEDIDIESKTVFVYQSKNNKDRFTLLGAKSIPIFLAYLKKDNPKNWLFESPDGGHYSVRSVQEIFSQAMAKAGIRKNLSTHALRHSFATHNIVKGMDIDLLRKLMGHSSIKTTQIYLHVTKERLLGTPSPLDDLDI